MGFFCGAVAVWLTLAVVQGKIHWDKAEANWKICLEETGAEESMESVMKKEIIPTSDKGMCLIECLMRMNKVYNSEGRYSREGAREHFDEIFEEQPEVIEKAMVLVEECSKIDIEGLDKCEAAVKHVTCGRTKFVQNNIKINRE